MDVKSVPVELLPAIGSLPTQVPIAPQAERTANPDRMAEACVQLGLVRVTPSMIRMHQVLGEEIEAMGVIKIAQSGLFAGQQFLLETLKDLRDNLEKCEDIDTKVQVAKTMGYVSGKLSEQSKAMISSSPKATGELQKAAPQRASFPPFAVINQTNISHGKESVS